MKRLKLNQIYFGKIDGYNEFLEYGVQKCQEIFFEFPDISVNSFIIGSKYYLLGNKGTGKTMFLKYIESKLHELHHGTLFVRFKHDMGEEEKNQIKRASLGNNFENEIIDKNTVNPGEVNCILAWEIYLIKKIIFYCHENENSILNPESEELNDLYKILCSLYGENQKKNFFARIIPKIKHGLVTLSANPKIDLDLEWDNKEKREIQFYKVAKSIISTYKKLHIKFEGDKRFYLLIDELELSMQKNKQYDRDIVLIRDLIFAIENLSDINRTNKFPIIILAAIRNEVYKSMLSIGMEINKPISDFGEIISWEQKGGNIENHPLLKMIEKRIYVSEKNQNINSDIKEIWDRYFTPKVHNDVDIKNYILDLTWLKPRDLIRLFNLIQKKYGEREFIDQECFDGVMHDYAKESWREFSEVLSAKYSTTDIEAIKTTLTSIAIPFDVARFRNFGLEKQNLYSNVKALFEKHQAGDILKDLYSIGIVGNYGRNKRFVFKGADDFEPTQPITLHRPLVRFFQANIIKGFQHVESGTANLI